MITLGLDIGSNSVGSAWVDTTEKDVEVAVSIFPAGVDESDDKRGDPKNLKRRSTRHARVTLARRAQRRRQVRLTLMAARLLPSESSDFDKVLENDPWVLRRKGLVDRLTPHEFGRAVLHLAQRRGAFGFDADADDQGKVKAAMTHVHQEMLVRYGSPEAREEGKRLRDTIERIGGRKKGRTDDESSALETACDKLKELCTSLLKDDTVTFGRLMADLRDERRHFLKDEHGGEKKSAKGNPSHYDDPIRNRRDSFQFHADRSLIRDEFAKLWAAQRRFGGPLAELLTEELRLALDNPAGDSTWRHQGALFGQRRTYWDTGTLGRCNLVPTERCVPHADMHASRYLVVETVNNIKIIETGKGERPLTPEERKKIKDYLSGPLGTEMGRKTTGASPTPADRPKRTVSVTDLRNLMGTSEEGWGRASKTSRFHFNIEADEDREINTDWFSREIIHGVIGAWKWISMTDRQRDGLNRAILKHDPSDQIDAARLKAGVMIWAGLSDIQADALIAACKRRPKLEKRLNLSRRAVRNILELMDREEPWPDPRNPGQTRWLTQIEARKLIAGDAEFKDATTGEPLDEHARRRYATGAKGATAGDRHYMKKHLLKKGGQLIYGPDGLPLAEPPPAPMISNPVVRKAIHEVRRHLMEYMTAFGRKPDQVIVELSREAKMGKKGADELLFKNRLRNRIRNSIINEFGLEARTFSQQRAAVDRVILCVQQRGVCPLCGKSGLTERLAANGAGCEVAHIMPKGSGGHNGFGNTVLAHDNCNRDMARRTPRQFWDSVAKGGSEEGLARVQKLYAGIERPKFTEVKTATGTALWSCYFTARDDAAKVAQFRKDVKDIQQMTLRQDAATKYATRQVMAYLADALFDGNGLPERGGDRLIFATDGLWTSRLRREWGLFFDRHGFKTKGLSNEETHLRKEKDRGDHRHHAIDAAVTALCTREVQIAWENREKQADKDGVNTASEEAMENYRRLHPLPPPAPFKDRDALREAVRLAAFGDCTAEKPVCHRPVKRKLIGALHKETLYGAVVGRDGKLTKNYTGKKSILAIEPNHLRKPREETKDEAVERLAERRMRVNRVDEKTARKWAREVVSSAAYTPKVVDPPPEKSGIVRDISLRLRIRDCLSGFQYVKRTKSGEPVGEPRYVNPDDFTDIEMKQAFDAGAIRHESGVPIRSVVLLRTMSDPVIASRWATDHQTGRRVIRYDARKGEGDARAARAYESRNNHHIEIRVARKTKGRDTWSGAVISNFEVAQRLLCRLRKIGLLEKPFRHLRKKLTKEERKGLTAEGIQRLSERRLIEWRQARQQLRPQRKAIIDAHPLVDRSDNKDGVFNMSLCEGEMLFMKHKQTGELGYFVIAKLDKPQSIVLVPHWDARAATERKDSDGKKVPDSRREQFAVTPSDLRELAPPGRPHAMKIRVSPLGQVKILDRD